RAKPLVSLGVPTYNGADYLAACLESIGRQTLDDYEVILVDDASDDHSHAIAQAYAAQDTRFRVYRNPQRLGLVSNWNRCLELSRGEWIKLLFQDDLIEPRCLERLVHACRSRGQSFAFCHRAVKYDAAAPEPAREFFARHEQWLSDFYGPADKYIGPAAFVRMAAAHPNWNPVGEPTVTLFHRSVLQRFGRFEPAMIQLCDAEYWLRLGSNVGVVHVAETLATFRVHGRSATSQNLSKQEYALRYLEPLVADYLVLHQKHYSRLRRELFRRSGRLTTWWRLIASAQDAWQTAAAAGDGALKQWSATTDAYPRLRRLARLGNRLAPLRAALGVAGLLRPWKKSHAC
ncbi:MAG TPA: glycosyltransferase family 2 protein, partial [Verrucomicrobiae bacterium]